MNMRVAAATLENACYSVLRLSDVSQSGIDTLDYIRTRVRLDE